MNARRLAILGFATCVFGAAPCSAQTLWNVANGNWSAAGNWTLGAPGAATNAQINNGGAAQVLAPGAVANNVTLGLAPFSSGSLDVLGGEAQFSSVLAVGAAGNGTLNITAGGQVSNTNGRIGRDAGGTGSALVTGPGSRWQNNGDLTVGSAAGGVGMLSIEHRATVYVQNHLSISSASTVTLSGGTLRFNTVAGLDQLNFLSGTIQLAGNRALYSDPTFAALFGNPDFPTPAVIPSGKRLVVEGSTSLKDFRSILVSGGALTSQGFLEVGGTTTGVDLGGNLEIYGGGVVTAAASSKIDVSGKAIVSGAGSRWEIAGNLSVATPDGFFSDLAIAAGGEVQVANDFAIANRGRMSIDGGTLRFNAFSADPDAAISFTSGTIQLAGHRTIGADAAIARFFGTAPTFSPGKELAVEGTATISGTAPVTFAGGALSAQTLLFLPGSNVAVAQPTVLAAPTIVLAGAVIDATGADLALGDPNNVNGFYGNGELRLGPSTVVLGDKNDAVLDSAALVTLGGEGSPGTLAAGNGLTLDFGGNITGHGLIDTPDNPARPLINNGNLIGESLAAPLTLAGYVKGAGTYNNVQFTGSFSPGFSPAQVNLGSARYDGVLEIEIGGLFPGSGHDQLNHILDAGVAELGGTLEVSLIGGFVPTLGQSFEIITASGGRQDTFAELALPSLGGGKSWNVFYGSNSVRLDIVAAGYSADFDHDGDVDGGDFLVWQRGLSPRPLSAADLASWKLQSGSGSFLPSFAADSRSVPEPGAALLLAAVVGAFVVRRNPGATARSPSSETRAPG